MGHEKRHLGMGQGIMGGAAKEKFAQSRPAIGTHHNQVAVEINGGLANNLTHRLVVSGRV